METFLVKSSLTMAVMLGLYYLLFEKEKMHRFNRFYLLGALAFSLAIPFITVITHVVEVNFIAEPMPVNVIAGNTASETPIDYWFFIGWGIYTLVTLVLAIRFTKNIWHFARKASQNPNVAMGNAILVLVEEKTLPHTFLNWIFINLDEYKCHSIEEELYTHEYTHVKEKHTIDILFIEVLKTVFWFNPLLYCYKKAIQLNHEFLADEKVIDTTANTTYYQNLLLEKASVGTTFPLASNLNFSITKQRFLMMTKTTSTVKATILKIAITPFIAGLMMMLCTKTVAQETPKKATERQTTTVKAAKTDPQPAQKANSTKIEKKEAAKKSTIVNTPDELETLYFDETNPTGSKTFTLSGPGKIDPAKIRSIEITPLTAAEIKAFQEYDPEAYSDEILKDYATIKITYINDEGKLVSETTYDKKPKN
jgi:hypothetical protein